MNTLKRSWLFVVGLPPDLPLADGDELLIDPDGAGKPGAAADNLGGRPSLPSAKALCA